VKQDEVAVANRPGLERGGAVAAEKTIPDRSPGNTTNKGIATSAGHRHDLARGLWRLISATAVLQRSPQRTPNPSRQASCRSAAAGAMGSTSGTRARARQPLVRRDGAYPRRTTPTTSRRQETGKTAFDRRLRPRLPVTVTSNCAVQAATANAVADARTAVSWMPLNGLRCRATPRTAIRRRTKRISRSASSKAPSLRSPVVSSTVGARPRARCEATSTITMA